MSKNIETGAEGLGDLRNKGQHKTLRFLLLSSLHATTAKEGRRTQLLPFSCLMSVLHSAVYHQDAVYHHGSSAVLHSSILQRKVHLLDKFKRETKLQREDGLNDFECYTYMLFHFSLKAKWEKEMQRG